MPNKCNRGNTFLWPESPLREPASALSLISCRARFMCTSAAALLSSPKASLNCLICSGSSPLHSVCNCQCSVPVSSSLSRLGCLCVLQRLQQRRLQIILELFDNLEAICKLNAAVSCDNVDATLDTLDWQCLNPLINLLNIILCIAQYLYSACLFPAELAHMVSECAQLCYLTSANTGCCTV